jgi:hypothetical protein
MFTSIMATIDIPGIDNDQDKLDLLVTNSSKKDPLYIFEKHGAKYFIDKLSTLFNLLSKKYMDGNSKEMSACVSFEAICKNRKSSWNTIHPELAVSYPTAKLTLLGCNLFLDDCFVNQTGHYLPHYMFEHLITMSGFSQPLWWRTYNTNMIENMTNDLSNVICNKITSYEYLEKYKPSNHDFVLNKNTNYYLDYEGFVFYRNKNIVNKIMQVDYSKIKTNEYYISHKFKHENIDKLIALEKHNNNIFPLTKIITTYHENSNKYINKFCAMILDFLLIKNNNIVLFKTMSEKAQISYAKNDTKTQISMLINTSKNWESESYDIFKKAFPEFEGTEFTKNIGSVIKSTTNYIEPWNENECDNKINEILNYDHEINKKILSEFMKLLIYKK